ISVDTGVVGTPKSCEGKVPVDTDILLPIYDSLTGGTGGNGIYNVYGFAQIHVTGYYFSSNNKQGTPVPCGAPDTCISGSFVRFVGIGEYGGPSLGNRVTLVS
nr:hypothetical protein [Actinomycetota bacterium]